MDAYSVKASEIKGLTPDARKRLAEWIARVDASNRRAGGYCGPLEHTSIRPAGTVETGMMRSERPLPLVRPDDAPAGGDWGWEMEPTPPLLVYQWGETGEARITSSADAVKWMRQVQGSKRAASVQPTRKPRAVAAKVGASHSAGYCECAQCSDVRRALDDECARLSGALERATRELDTLRRVVGAAESIQAWAIATAKDVDGMVSDPTYTPAETWQERRQALARLTDA